MSNAKQCDLCEAFFRPTGGEITLDVHVMREDERSDSWSDVDFCAECSKKVIAVIHPAIKDLCPS